MPHVDILYAQLQKIETDIVKIQQAVRCFESSISNIRNRLPSSLEETQDEPAAQRRCLRGNSAQDLNAAAREIYDCIVTQIKDRFKFLWSKISVEKNCPRLKTMSTIGKGCLLKT